jgi:hypothetical protein
VKNKEYQINGHSYKIIEYIHGKGTGHIYKIIEFTIGESPFSFGWDSSFSRRFEICPCEFDSIEECKKYLQKRDLMIASGNSVM